MRLDILNGQQWMRTPAASSSDQYLLFNVMGLVILRVIRVYLLQLPQKDEVWDVLICDYLPSTFFGVVEIGGPFKKSALFPYN